jgi:hypothetical protein
MICGNRNDMVAIRHKISKRLQPDESDRIVQGMHLKPINQHGIIKRFFHRCISIYMQ